MKKPFLILIALLVVGLIMYFFFMRDEYTEEEDTYGDDVTTETIPIPEQPTTETTQEYVEHNPQHPVEVGFRATLDQELMDAFSYSRVITHTESTWQEGAVWAGSSWAYEINKDSMTMDDLRLFDEILVTNFETTSIREGAENMDEAYEWYGEYPSLDMYDEWCAIMNREGRDYFACFHFQNGMLWVNVE